MPDGFLLVRSLVLTLVLTGLAGLIAVRAVRAFVLNVLARLVSVRTFVPDVLFGLIAVGSFALTGPAGLVRMGLLCLLVPGITQAGFSRILLSLLIFFF